jgi:hypothetical protein
MKDSNLLETLVHEMAHASGHGEKESYALDRWFTQQRKKK